MIELVVAAVVVVGIPLLLWTVDQLAGHRGHSLAHSRSADPVGTDAARRGLQQPRDPLGPYGPY